MILGAGGALRLASDCAQLEFALTLILGPSGFSSSGPTGLNAIGPAYQLLRSYRALLFLTPEDIQKYDGRNMEHGSSQKQNPNNNKNLEFPGLGSNFISILGRGVGGKELDINLKILPIFDKFILLKKVIY